MIDTFDIFSEGWLGVARRCFEHWATAGAELPITNEVPAQMTRKIPTTRRLQPAFTWTALYYTTYKGMASGAKAAMLEINRGREREKRKQQVTQGKVPT